MGFYNPKVIPRNDRLSNIEQHQLTLRTTFKLLETGVLIQKSTKQFVIRLVRYVVYDNGKPYVIFVDMTKNDLDNILSKIKQIRYLLRSNTNRTVYQNQHIHVWTKRAPKHQVGRPAMLVFRGQNGKRIYIVERTFSRIMDLADSIEKAFDKFNMYSGKYYNEHSDYFSDDYFN